jgi:hypothetical protein
MHGTSKTMRQLFSVNFVTSLVNSAAWRQIMGSEIPLPKEGSRFRKALNFRGKVTKNTT